MQKPFLRGLKRREQVQKLQVSLFGVVIYTAIVVVEWRFTWVTRTDRKQVKQTDGNKDGVGESDTQKESKRIKASCQQA